MTSLEEFQSHRPVLFSVAYRMLGSASDAEDVVQDAWLRAVGAAPGEPRSIKAWLTTIVSRLCLDRLKSARARREEYIGPWLPEPVLTSAEGPDAMLQREESVTLAFLVLLDTLSSQERAVFLLKEVFDYSHDEIAAMLELTPAHARQLLHRAKARMAARRPRSAADPRATRELAERFTAALASGDAAVLRALLAEDAGFWGDGGGKVAAAKRPILGRDAVLNVLLGIQRVAAAQGLLPEVRIAVVDVNFEPALAVRLGGRLDSIYALEVDQQAIRNIRVIRNPDKLAFIDRQLARLPASPGSRP